MLDALYERIARTPETSGFFSSQSTIAADRTKLTPHWSALFAHGAGAHYLGCAEKAGKANARIGLSPQWHSGAYARVLEPIMRKQAGPFAHVIGGKIATLIKLALLDMEIAAETCFAAEEERRSKVMDAVGEALRRMTDGDFSVPLTGLPSWYVSIQHDFETMRATVGAALGDLVQTSQALDMGAQEVRQASEDLARRTEQQAASLEVASAAMSTLAARVSSTANDAVHLHHAVQSAHSDAQAGGGVADEAVQAMTDSHNSAREIGKIISVIDGIASQT